MRSKVVSVGAKSPSRALGTFWCLTEGGMQGPRPGLCPPRPLPPGPLEWIQSLCTLTAPIALWALTVSV